MPVVAYNVHPELTLQVLNEIVYHTFELGPFETVIIGNEWDLVMFDVSR